MRGKHFNELDPAAFSGKTIVLDVDGTLVVDRSHEIDELTADRLHTLSEVARVYLCSNALGPERLRQFAGPHTHYIDLPYKKPNTRVMEGIPEEHRKEVVVIGDKYLTDGLLALFTGSQFVKVERLHFRHERLGVHIAYAIDGTVGWLVFYIAKLFFRT